MKIVNILTVFVLSMMIFLSCDKSEQPVSGKEGGLIEIKNPSINYVVNFPGPYTASVRVYQGEIKTTKIEVYKTFNSVKNDTAYVLDTATNENDTVVTIVPISSNTVLFKTIDISSTDQNSIQSFDFTPEELKADLILEGNSLPALDGDYRIGDNWEFTYMASTSDGRINEQNTTTKATVATRYAGKYKCVEAYYYRIGVLTYTEANWPAETLIESVDAKTYRVIEYWGAFNGNPQWYFQIDASGVISYPAEWDGVAQTFNGQPMITCQTNPTDMTEVCGLPNANTVINDDVNGKDHLIMAVGYYTPGSGPRVMYQVMEKIVE